MDTYFAVTAPGLEFLVAKELNQLELLEPRKKKSKNVQHYDLEPGGITFEGDAEALFKANLFLRTSSRILVRIGNFYAAAFSELRKKASRLPWGDYLIPGQSVSIHVTSKKSRLYHVNAIAERVAGAISDHLGKPALLAKANDPASFDLPQQVFVRLINNDCTISIDSSGALLHRRGYRQATAKAPIRETLAAAMLLLGEWDTRYPLIDPFCGSGTIPIEAALLASGIPPGYKRNFAFMNWPIYDLKIWKNLKDGISIPKVQDIPLILASDRDAGAIKMAQANAERAGVANNIKFLCQSISDLNPPDDDHGWIISNPPYGIRVSPTNDLRNLYSQIGNVLRARCPGWHVCILCNDFKLLTQTRLPLDTSISMINGGIKVKLARCLIHGEDLHIR
jgi:putative N6-adenine-specific DNA methylase